jgi:dienelactone hydrolase
MTEFIARDVVYRRGDVEMHGLLRAPVAAAPLPAVLLVHDAFGLGAELRATAERLAELGFAVFAADVWGERLTPGSQDEIGPLIGGMAQDRGEWLARIAAAHEAAIAQPEIDPERIAGLGYCFGGSSVLEHLRTGAALRGVAAIHAGLDLIEFEWVRSRPGSSVLLCTGADDPMATSEQRERLQGALDGAGVDWEVDLYSGTVHAFTSENAKNSPVPHVFAYHERSAARAWNSTVRFLGELLDPHGAEIHHQLPVPPTARRIDIPENE